MQKLTFCISGVKEIQNWQHVTVDYSLTFVPYKVTSNSVFNEAGTPFSRQSLDKLSVNVVLKDSNF